MATNTNRAQDIRAARELVKAVLRQAEQLEAEAERRLTSAAELREQAASVAATFGL